MTRDMNEIESRYLSAFNRYLEREDVQYDIEPQAVVGVYSVDFLIDRGMHGKYVIEIDGHEYHKTKEQRERDYKRERYLMSNGYVPIRFMGTEVFLDADKCVEDTIEIINVLDYGYEEFLIEGMSMGKNQACNAFNTAWKASIDQAKEEGIDDPFKITKVIAEKLFDADSRMRG